MQITRIFSAVALTAFAIVVDANPTPMLEAHGTGLERRVPQQTSGDACIKAPLSADWSSSYYTFTIDAEVKDRAAQAGKTKIGVLQHCNSNGGFLGMWATNTENWAYVPLDKFGPDQKYNVKVDRCQKDKDRHVWKYSVWLCDDDNWCGQNRCGLEREICPEQKTKAVNLDDPLKWTCTV